MKNEKSLGLVVEGSSTASPTLRLHSLAQELGPVKGKSLRVARRMSNFLGAGYAIGEYKELHGSKLILIRVPDSAVDRIVDDLCNSELPVKDVSFVLCETCLTSNVLTPLCSRGAFTATMMAIPSVRRSWFVVEGQLTATRQVRRLLERNAGRALELRSGTKPLYFAAHLLALNLTLPLLTLAQQCLRAAGISGNQLHDLLEEMSLETFRVFANGGRMSWPALKQGCTAETASENLELLRVRQPEVWNALNVYVKSAHAAKIPSLRL